jgi:uncharacterized RDD family membrane protein YckC
MSEPTEGAPPPPQQPAPSAPAAPAWQAPAASTVAAGPAPGVAYADTVSRIIAMVIDGLVLFFIYFILVVLIAVAVGGNTGNLVVNFVFGLIWAVATLAYYVYTWTRMRASLGQKVLGLETVSAADGATLTQDQAVRRWAWLWGPFALSGVLPIIGGLLGIVAFFYGIYLLYTVTQSPKRQGLHDVQAATVVVKRI